MSSHIDDPQLRALVRHLNATCYIVGTGTRPPKQKQHAKAKYDENGKRVRARR